jgi:hypothetical protein
MGTAETKDDLRDKKIKLLTSFAESSWTEYDTRRSYEWKVNFALWASFGLIAGFSIKESYPLGDWIWFIIAFIAVIYIRWQLGLHNSSRHDQKKRHFYEEKIRLMMKIYLPDDLKKPPSTSNENLFLNWSHGSQIFITISFLVLLGFILTSGLKDNNNRGKDENHQHHNIEYKYNHFRR